MTETERDRQLLKDLLAEADRDTRRPAPPFELLWSRAAAQMRPRRQARRRRFALAATLALVLAATIAWWTTDRQGPGELEQAMTVAAAAGEWQAPLDFLLDTPGQEWLEAAPGWALEPTLEPWSLAPDLIESDAQRR